MTDLARPAGRPAGRPAATPLSDRAAVPVAVLDALMRIAAQMVGITAMAVAQAAPATELTLAQWRALVVIGDSDGMHVGDVARRVGASVPSASRLIRRLELRGFVTAERDESDRRATVVRSTTEGASVRANVIARRRELLGAALEQRSGALPPALAPGLMAIAEALEQAV